MKKKNPNGQRRASPNASSYAPVVDFRDRRAPAITSLHTPAGFREQPDFDPLAAAQREADAINANRHAVIYGGLERVLRDAPQVDRRALLADIAAYHREAMERVPSFLTYPEARPWVEHVRTLERELVRLASLNAEEIAMVKSLGPYLTFRGFRRAGIKTAPPPVEKCRIAFLRDTDRGPMTIKNVDDPLSADWQPLPPLPARLPRADFFWEHVNWVADGTGSGLHIDDEPDELFPLPVLAMCGRHAGTTGEVVAFLRRYAPFWGGGNLLVYDHRYASAAIEKTSRNHFQAYDATDGHNHISGMACRDPQSPQAQYVRARRAEYRRLYNLPDDGLDQVFWDRCDVMERKLADALAAGAPRFKADDLIRLFRTPWPEGLCKTGAKLRPDQVITEYTQIIYAQFFERRQYLRYRLTEHKALPRDPEICQFD